MSIAPDTVMIIASHSSQPRSSPRTGTARIATNIGKVLVTGIMRDTSSERIVRSMRSAPTTRMMLEPTATTRVMVSTPAGSGRMVITTSPNTKWTTPIGARNARKLGILFEMRWLSSIETRPVIAAEMMATVIHMVNRQGPFLVVVMRSIPETAGNW